MGCICMVVLGKCTLAARCDAVHSAPDGSMGKKLMEELDGKLDKILAPPEVKSVSKCNHRPTIL